MKFIIVGCGRMGSTLARTLVLRDHTVTVVDQDPDDLCQTGSKVHGQDRGGCGVRP